MERKGNVRPGQVGIRRGSNYVIFPSAQSKQDAIAKSTQQVEELKQRLESLKSSDENCLPFCVPTLGKLEVGAVGSYELGEVVEVVDGNTVIVAFARFAAPQTVIRGGQLATGGGRRLPDLVIWAKVPTAGMTTGGQADLTKTVLVVTGTRTYDTVEGTNTAFVLEPFDMEPVKKLWAERRGKGR